MELGEPSPKRHCSSQCIICLKKLTGHIVKSPSETGLLSLIHACEVRGDDVAKRILPIKDQILARDYPISFHKACRSTYASKSNLKYAEKAPGSATEGTSDSISNTDETPARLTRGLLASSQFDIRSQCFICGKSSQRSEKLTKVVTGSGDTTRQKVLRAASAREDDVVYQRMVAHPDLFAYDAKYHRSCYSHYISERNVNAAQRRSSTESKSEDLAFDKLVQSITSTVLSGKKIVTSLSSLKGQYEGYLKESKEPGGVYSWRLKKRLINHFGDRLVFIDRIGKSNIVCSSDVTVGTALRKASELKEQLENEDDILQMQSISDSSPDDENIVLYRAASILRHSMAEISDSGEYYIPSTDISKNKCAEFVPNLLYDFISWLVNENSYKNMSSCSIQPSLKTNISSVSICHDIIGQCRNIRTPVTLGLGIYIQHEFGSKELVEELHAMGHCVSYDEVRRFLTSAALEQQSQDAYVPKGLRTAQDPEFAMVDAAIDNFDQNEETLDGKLTTHALAAVVYQRCLPSPQTKSSIERVNQKSLKDVFIIDDIKRYTKPARRPEPTTITDSSYVEIEAIKKKDALMRDYLWLISRQLHANDAQQECPSWTGFNTLISNVDLPLATVRYLPFLNAPPSDLDTIYTMLLRLVKLANQLGQQHILVTADMAIYSKAQQILWAHLPELDGKVTMRIGGMHMTMAFIACLGTLYGDGGLHSLLVDSNVYSEATANQMLQGKQYARGVRGIKLVHEALYRLLFKAMESWLAVQSRNISTEMVNEKIHGLQNAVSMNDAERARVLTKELEDEHMSPLMTIIQEFRDFGRTQSETFAYWDNFLTGGDVLLHMLRAEREGNFELHLQATSEAVPWFYAASRNQYKKFAPMYVAEMKALAISQPDTYKHLLDGGFVVRRTPSHTFNAIATDQALEQTVNRDGKSKGGVIGLTRRKTALTRWLTTRHITAEYVEAFSAKESSQNKPHQELGKARRERDENDVIKIVENATNVQNPFDLNTVPGELINIITGQVASQEVRGSLNSFLEQGAAKHREFISNRVTSSKTKSYWDTESRLKIKTFADMKKPVINKAKEKLIVDSEVLFRRLLVVSKRREVNLQDVLTHELSAISPSLFYDDGTMRKTTKSDLAKKLEASVDQCTTDQLRESVSSAYILDGMALIQGIKETMFVTFLDLANVLLKFLLNPFDRNQGVESVCIVFDRYDQTNSVKAAERNRRGETHQAGYVIQDNRQVPNYRQFLKASGNKAALAAFVSDHIASVAPSMLSRSQKIILAGGFNEGHIAKLVTSSGAAMIPSLFSSQEEADTRMLLHAIDLSSSHDRLIVRSDDTDVLVLLLYYCSKGMLTDLVYMLAGHNTPIINRQRYIPVHTIMAKQGVKFCESLPAAHALTGCDSTSSFYQIGKRVAYTKLQEHVEKNLLSLATFGLQNNIEADVLSARSYVLSLYGKRAKTCSSLDQLRYLLASTTDKPATQLPPTEDAFKQHVLRARYQTRIWCKSHIANLQLDSPVGNGWCLSDGQLEPVIYTKESAPVEVRDLTHMYCTDHDCRQSNKCHCLLNQLHCTEFCTCHGGCQNIPEVVFDSDNDDDDNPN